jgi:hypothetical protein
VTLKTPPEKLEVRIRIQRSEARILSVTTHFSLIFSHLIFPGFQPELHHEQVLRSILTGRMTAAQEMGETGLRTELFTFIFLTLLF